MLKAAALVTVELCIRLAEKGLTLQDGHPWNILFDDTKPVYIDAGSIVLARDDILWAPYQQFCNFFLFPLYLYAADRDRIARWLLRDYLSGVTDEDLLAALPGHSNYAIRGGRSVSRCPNGPANYWNSCPTICSSGFFPFLRLSIAGRQI